MIAAGPADERAEVSGSQKRRSWKKRRAPTSERGGSDVRNDNDNDDHSFESQLKTRTTMGGTMGHDCGRMGAGESIRHGHAPASASSGATGTSNNQHGDQRVEKETNKEEQHQTEQRRPGSDLAAALATGEDNMTRRAGERNKWEPSPQQTSGKLSAQLMQIVESADRKLMMNALGGRRDSSYSEDDDHDHDDHDHDHHHHQELEERGGPTPTNEFVRRLRDRDRLALKSTWRRRPQPEVGASPTPDALTGDEGARVGRSPDKTGLDGGVLARLISKCQLSAGAASRAPGARSPEQRRARPRTPSDPSPVVGVARVPIPHRRHSTYLLPQVLADSQRRRASRSDLDSSDSAHTAPLSSGSSSESPDEPLEAGWCSPPRQLGVPQTGPSEQASLANSASSPSSLSTPTNDLRAGCGGPCCRTPPRVAEEHCKEHLPPRTRLGSNPLDRLMRQPSRRRATGNRSLRSGVPPSTKRHSIINILRSPGVVTQQPPGSATANLVSSRLSQALAFFAGHPQGQQNSPGQWCPDEYDAPLPISLDCSQPTDRKRLVASQQPSETSGHQLQYDPLIPESGFKIVVMGTSGSGKTSIIRRFLYDSFESRHFATVEDTYFIEFPYLKNMINISISDTSGTYQFPAMRKLAINSGDAFILVYSVDKPDSLAELEKLRQTILEEREQAYLEASLLSSCSSSPLCSTNNFASSQALFDSSVASSSSSLHSNATSSYSTGDSSRRSSLSPAEAALKTRRTRRPPMVIVANKCDLPEDQHLINSDEIKALAVIDWNNGFVEASALANININDIFQQVLKQAKQPPMLTEAIVSKRRRSLPPKLATNYGGGVM